MRVRRAGEGACLGHRVVCVDKDEGKIAGLRAGRLPIYEPGLQELVEGGLRRQRLSFSSGPSGAVDEADVLLIERKKVISKALLGLSFKPNTDDLRGAPSLEIAGALDSLDAQTVGYDPVAGKAAAKKLPSLKVVFDPYEALEGAHAAVILTEWEEVREVRAAGMCYRGFGRGYGLGQGRSQVEAAAGARTWRGG